VTAREDRRGGRRPGAGRPAGDRQRWSVAAWVTPTERATIEAAAHAAGVSVARFLLDAALARAAQESP
jgi:uncharacterized protein (DUF1778 family)